MRWIPYEAFEIECSASAAEVKARLESTVERPRFLSLGRPDRLFVGSVHPEGFDVQRVSRSGAAFALEMHGRFRATEGATVVSVEVVPATATLAVIATLILGVILLVFRSGPRVPLLCAGAVATAWLLGMAGFWLDAGRSRRLLCATLDAQNRRSGFPA